MKKFALFLSVFLAFAAFAAEQSLDVKSKDWYLKGTLTITKDLEPGVYYIVKNDGKHINMNVLVKKYSKHNHILFHTYRLDESGKPFVLERSFPFKTGQKYTIEIKYADGKAQLFFNKTLRRNLTCDKNFRPGLFKNISKDPVVFTVEEFRNGSETVKK